MNLQHLSDEQLLSGLMKVRSEGHDVLARELAHLAEVEARRLDLEAACPSLYEFCIRRLGMSNGQAFRRIAAARVARRFPSVFGAVSRGEINVTSIVMLRELFTDENVDELLREVSGKTTREVEEVVARLAPKPDVPSQIRALPVEATAATLPLVAAPEPERAKAPPKQKVVPLSVGRHEIRFTASTELRDQIEYALDLMRHRNPSGDLEVVFAKAMKLLVPELEKGRLGKTERPQKKRRTIKAGRIAQAVRRAVFARDGNQCTFVSADHERCPCRSGLELDHVVPRAKGGSDEVDNLRVRCRAHNRLHAEHTFGREHVEELIHFRQRTSRRVKAPAETAPVAANEDPFALASGALTSMGYREKEARKAVSVVKERHGPRAETQTVVTILREALAVLSS